MALSISTSFLAVRMHLLLIQRCFFKPGPPFFFLSRQNLHSLQSSLIHPGHSPHGCLRFQSKEEIKYHTDHSKLHYSLLVAALLRGVCTEEPSETKECMDVIDFLAANNSSAIYCAMQTHRHLMKLCNLKQCCKSIA